MDFLNDTAGHGQPGRLAGKRVLITGATSGIGRGCAMHMAEEGARLIFTGRNEEGAAETLRMVREVAPEAEIEFVRQDVTMEADWTRLYDRVREVWGAMDVLFSNAGDAKLGPLEDVTPEDLNFLYKVNVEGQFIGLRDGLPLMAPG
ncbi:MAG: SDR family NAD(P)-dependent oxidoreductase, partial [Gammaproteobacteria bacterium]|nr:SDR family NAD(P)-dependent oxidoreductase [Gammaproteobacteria bacterium]